MKKLILIAVIVVLLAQVFTEFFYRAKIEQDLGERVSDELGLDGGEDFSIRQRYVDSYFFGDKGNWQLRGILNRKDELEAVLPTRFRDKTTSQRATHFFSLRSDGKSLDIGLRVGSEDVFAKIKSEFEKVEGKQVSFDIERIMYEDEAGSDEENLDNALLVRALVGKELVSLGWRGEMIWRAHELKIDGVVPDKDSYEYCQSAMNFLANSKRSKLLIKNKLLDFSRIRGRELFEDRVFNRVKVGGVKIAKSSEEQRVVKSENNRKSGVIKDVVKTVDVEEVGSIGKLDSFARDGVFFAEFLENYFKFDSADEKIFDEYLRRIKIISESDGNDNKIRLSIFYINGLKEDLELREYIWAQRREYILDKVFKSGVDKDKIKIIEEGEDIKKYQSNFSRIIIIKKILK